MNIYRLRIPPAPVVLVEGPQLFPSFLAPLLPSHDQALFLLPDPAEQRERLLARGPMAATPDPERARSNAIERNVLISRQIEDEANAPSIPPAAS